ncbi:S-adenosylmethionine transporter [Marasmius crinis-equi]|uniref:S-adenosylmethionine transporter n=1 Tax=Marasmius crinis-equi TaxID=585013 RepID=A0ABR3FFM7_9AGAR
MSASRDSVKPSFVQSLVSGGAAGTAVDLLFFPIDTIKTRLQSSQGFVRAGGFKGIYKGVGSVVVGSAPGAAVFFTTYDTLKHSLPSTLLSTNPNVAAPLTHMIAASVGEVAACLVRVPTEVIKTRAQTGRFGTNHQSSLSAFRLTVAHEGLSGLYRGFGITVMREIPFTSLQFPLYEFLKVRLGDYLNRPIDQPRLYAHEAAICGSIAGGFAAALTTPLDVLKTRVMLDLRTSGEARLSLYSRLTAIYQKEGMKALFSGVVPRTMWISAGGAVFLGVYEWAVGGLIASGVGS